MTLEERYALSCYEPLSQMQEKKDVWLVRHNEEGNLYIKKIIELYNKDIYQKLMELQPANVPKIIMCVEEDSKLIVIEEYIHGISLEKKLENEGVFSQEMVLELMMKLCDIIKPLHNSVPPIIHRDIKPANIMVSSDGVIKLVDFNAAKEFNPSQNEDTRLIGTQHFAAPEQYGFGQSDQRTDIYAMGITMYYLLTGNYPTGDIMHGQIGKIIKTCTYLDKQGRYQDVDTLKADLERTWKGIKSNDMPKEMSSNGKKSVFARSLYKRRWFLPVGFRSGIPWKMILAFYGYAISLWFSMTMEVTNSKGESFTGYPLWLNRIAVFILLLGSILFVGNYLGIKEQLPLMGKNKILSWILTGVYLAIYYIMVVLLLIILGGGG